MSGDYGSRPAGLTPFSLARANPFSERPCSDRGVYILFDIYSSAGGGSAPPRALDTGAHMPDRPPRADRLLPLKPKVLHILLALADGPRHGYGIMQDVAARTDGHVRLWPAALYGSLRELEEQDLIVESEHRPSDDDERRRYFALTPLGKRVLSAEVRRLETIVGHARASRALREPGRA